MQLGILARAECGDGGAYNRRGVSNGSVAESNAILVARIVVSVVDISQYPVHRQGEVGIEAEPRVHVVATGKLNTCAVALADILHKWVVALRHQTRGHKLVFVEHGVKIGFEMVFLLAYLISELDVEHGFRLDGVAHVHGILDVGACRLAVGQTGDKIETLVLGQKIIDAHFRIEEEAGRVVVKVVVVVVGATQRVADTAQLEVGIEVKVVREVIVQLGKGHSVALDTGISVPVGKRVLARDKVVGVVLRPDNRTHMQAAVVLVAAAQHSRQGTAAVTQRQVACVGIVAHVLVKDKVTSTDTQAKGDVVFQRRLVVLVALVVAVAVGIVESGIERPTVTQKAGVVQLVVLLLIVVALVIIIAHITKLIIVFAGAIVVRVAVQVCAVGAIPGDAGLLLADNHHRLQQRDIGVVAGRDKGTLLVGEATAHKAVAGQAVICNVEREAVLRQTRSGKNTVLARVPRTQREVGLAVRFVGSIESLYVQGTAKSRRAAVGSSNSTLNLYALRHTAQVGDVYPVYSLALGIVEWQAVYIHVDARGINTAYAERRGSDHAVLGGDNDRRLHLHHVGHCGREFVLLQRLARHGAGR